ncbi:1-phosphofructokinase family hexose kinase [Bradyrhizobium sp. STM 3562]|uniref:1-phosphofructokinase family hexose kinase n=1 Tax=Bradyrhizobium sp. STM 3562 TaxID=578924 RepID=UPI00388D7C40
MIQQPEVVSKPIVTLTLNPTIDLAFQSNEIRPIRKNRAVEQRIDAGGGGINVARVLKELGAEACAIYLAGGATGLVLNELVAKLDVPAKCIDIAGGTRISFTVFEEISGLEYRFVSEGCTLLEPEWQSALSHLRESDADYVVASGSLPPGVPIDFYARLAGIVRSNGARLILDTSGPALQAALSAGGIYLAKPSLGEFETLTHRKFESAGELVDAASSLVATGAIENLAVTMGRDGALLAHPSGTLRLKGPKVKPLSAVGAGDSFVAGMTFALARRQNVEDAFMLGMAAGAAAVLTHGTQLCRREDIERLHAEVMAERLSMQAT